MLCAKLIDVTLTSYKAKPLYGKIQIQLGVKTVSIYQQDVKKGEMTVWACITSCLMARAI